jgi:hypothetical protein
LQNKQHSVKNTLCIKYIKYAIVIFQLLKEVSMTKPAITLGERLDKSEQIRKAEFARSKSSTNKLILVEGFEGKGQESIMLGKDVLSNKSVRVSLRPQVKVGNKPRPTAEMLLDDKYAHKVDVGAIIVAEGCQVVNSDNGELSARWFQTYQAKSMNNLKKWLAAPLEERKPKEYVSMALNGLCNITLNESYDFKDSGGTTVSSKANIKIDLYSPTKAEMSTVTSKEELISLIAKAITPTSKIVESSGAALIRCFEKENNKPYILGVPFTRELRVGDNYELEDPMITAGRYLEAVTKKEGSVAGAICDALEDGEQVDLEYVPATSFFVRADSLENTRVFDADGKILRSAEGVESKTSGERYMNIYRESKNLGSGVRLVDTNISVVFNELSNKPIVSKFESSYDYSKSCSLENLPTKNFTPTPVIKKSNKTVEKSIPTEDQPKGNNSQSLPVEDKSPRKQSDVSNDNLTPPVPSDISEDELRELDAAFSELEDFEMPGLDNK